MRGASNESGVVENGDFRFIRSLSSEHCTYMATRQLADHTTVSGSATNGLASRTRLFENLQSYPYTASDKNVAQGT